MALIDYAALVEDVRALIDGTGREVTFKRLTSFSPDPEKPWKPEQIPDESTDVYATFVPLSSLQELGFVVTDSELLKRASQACIVAPHATVDLSKSHVLVDDGVAWRVHWCSVLRPGDTELLLAFGISQ